MARATTKRMVAVAGGVCCLAAAAWAETGSPTANEVSQFGLSKMEMKKAAGVGVQEAPAFAEGGAPNDDCANAQLITCGSTVQADLTATTTVPSDPGYSCHNGGPGTQGIGTVWYKFVATHTDAQVSTCSSGVINPAAADSLIGVYSGTCGAFTEIACSDDICGQPLGFNARVCATGLTVGETYYIQISCWSEGDRAVYTVELDCPCGECTVPCPPGSNTEGEPVCFTDYVDNYNFGCNSTPPSFTPISCNQTVCGEFGVHLFGGANRRDNDWYLITVAQPTVIRWQATAEAPLNLLIVNFQAAGNSCATLIGNFASFVLDSAIGPECDLTVTEATVNPGSYILIVRPSSVNDPTPCGTPYVAEVICSGAEPGACCLVGSGACVDGITSIQCAAQSGVFQGVGTSCIDLSCCNVQCSPGSTPEGEPTCFVGYVDATNAGCNNTSGIAFSLIACGQTVCGTYGTFGSSRDTDWYDLFLSGQTYVTWTVTGEASTSAFIILQGPDPLDPCTGLQIISAGSTDACEANVVSACVDPGSTGGVWLFAATSVFTGIPCGAEYEATVTCEVPCPAPDIGACCFASGACTDGLTLDGCDKAGGIWQGPDSTCATANCPQPCPCDPPGAINPDRDGDCDVDSTDLNIVLTNIPCSGSCPGDADGDGDTDSTDLNIILTSLPCPGG